MAATLDFHQKIVSSFYHEVCEQNLSHEVSNIPLHSTSFWMILIPKNPWSRICNKNIFARLCKKKGHLLWGILYIVVCLDATLGDFNSEEAHLVRMRTWYWYGYITTQWQECSTYCTLGNFKFDCRFLASRGPINQPMISFLPCSWNPVSYVPSLQVSNTSCVT